MGLVTDTRGLWAAAWLDAGDEMKESYAKIIAVKDPVRRAELLRRFADVPVRMEDLRAQRRSGDVRKSNGDLDAWNARTRMKWSENVPRPLPRTREGARRLDKRGRDQHGDTEARRPTRLHDELFDDQHIPLNLLNSEG